MNSSIPKRIIQVWGDGEHLLSPFAQAATANVKLLNPEFEYLFFDDERIDQFVTEHCPEYKCMFASFQHRIQRYDFFRYLAVFYLGGFYFDLDVFLYKPLRTLLHHNAVFPFERIGINQYTKRVYNMHWDVGNFAFAARPQHPFLGAIITNCIQALTDPRWAQTMLMSIPWLFRKDAYVICTTGPGVVTRTYAESTELRSTVTILKPDNIFDRESWTQFGSYGIDISCYVKRSAWRRPSKNKLMRTLWNYWYSRTETLNIRAARQAVDGVV